VLLQQCDSRIEDKKTHLYTLQFTRDMKQKLDLNNTVLHNTSSN